MYAKGRYRRKFKIICEGFSFPYYYYFFVKSKRFSKDGSTVLSFPCIGQVWYISYAYEIYAYAYEIYIPFHMIYLILDKFDLFHMHHSPLIFLFRIKNKSSSFSLKVLAILCVRCSAGTGFQRFYFGGSLPPIFICCWCLIKNIKQNKLQLFAKMKKKK